MRRRVPLQKLRGSDPTLLEVQVTDLLTRPSAQLEPPNLCDLFALNELEAPPKNIAEGLDKFVERARGELAEIADGASMAEFVEEVRAVDAERVPDSFRDLLGALAAREGRDGAPLEALLTELADTEPKAFALGETAVKVQRAEAAAPPKERVRKGVGGKTETPKAKKKAAPKRSAAKPLVDPEMHTYIREMVIERLERSPETGLAEKILLAGVRHRSREVYPKLLPQQVMAVLKDLLERGLVRKSAGRWSAPRRPLRRNQIG